MIEREPTNRGFYDRMRTTEGFRKAGRSYPVREFIVEFFGILLPGFAFTTGLFPTLLFPALALVMVLPQSRTESSIPLTTAENS
jgi:hypothetical protein